MNNNGGKCLESSGGGGGSSPVGNYLKLDQTVPQDVSGGKPIFADGITIPVDPVEFTDAVNKKFVLDVAANDFIEFPSSTVDSGLGGINYVMDYTPAVADTITGADVTGTDQNIFNHITPANVPINKLAKGTYFLNAELKKNLTFLVGTKKISIYVELWEADNLGADVSLVGTTVATPVEITTTSTLYSIPITIASDLTVTRLKLKWFANLISGSFTGTVTLTLGGTSSTLLSIRVNDAVFEQVANKVTSVSSASTDNQYASAKTTYTLDQAVFHKTVANEINQETDKPVPVDADIVLGENSAGGVYSKIKMTLGSFYIYIIKPKSDLIYQLLSNLVTAWQVTPDNTHNPSEKLVKDSLDLKQATLQSGVNIRTVNGNTLLGSTNLVITPGGANSDTTAFHNNTANEITGLTAETAINDNSVLLAETGVAAAFTKVKIAFSSIKSTLKTYFDTLYCPTSDVRLKHPAGLWAIDKDTALTVKDNLTEFRVPPEFDGFKIVSLGGAVRVPSSSGLPTFMVQVGRQSSPTSAHVFFDVLLTAITIDVNTYDSKDATTSPVIDTSVNTVHTGDLVIYNCTGAGTGTKGFVPNITFG